MQSNSVVRGSMCSVWSLPLMRSVIDTAPSTAEPSTLRVGTLSCATACAGVCTARTSATNVVPVVKMNWRRFGCGDLAKLLSSSIVVNLTRSHSTLMNCFGDPLQTLLNNAQQCSPSSNRDYKTELPFRGSSFGLTYSRPRGPIAVTCATYSPDLAQWKWDVSPGRTITVPGAYASNFSGSNWSPKPM